MKVSPERGVTGFVERGSEKDVGHRFYIFLFFIDYHTVVMLRGHDETGRILWRTGKWFSADYTIDAPVY
jgi:hypothetical protein